MLVSDSWSKHGLSPISHLSSSKKKKKKTKQAQSFVYSYWFYFLESLWVRFYYLINKVHFRLVCRPPGVGRNLPSQVPPASPFLVPFIPAKFSHLLIFILHTSLWFFSFLSYVIPLPLFEGHSESSFFNVKFIHFSSHQGSFPPLRSYNTLLVLTTFCTFGQSLCSIFMMI